MKSFLLVIGLIFAQSAFCQSTTIKAGLKNATIISDTIQTPRPLKNLNLPVIYTFTGNGSWSNVNNWDANGIPPNDGSIPPGSEIHINSQTIGAQCVLDIPFTIPNTTNTIKLIVYTGNKLVVPNLTVR